MVEPVAADAPVEVRFLRPDEASRLTEAIERSYGRSYDGAWAYDVDEIRRRLACGSMRSIVGVDPSGEVVGHLALDRREPTAPGGHAGQAVVDPRYRGHHLFTTLKRELATWCTSEGLLGMYSEATAAHPYSQAANLALGAHETGFLLGYIPSQVSYTRSTEDARGHRQSVALFWLTTNPAPARVVHPPRVAPRHRRRRLRPQRARPLARRRRTRSRRSTVTTRLTVTEHEDHNEATVVDRTGRGGRGRGPRRACSRAEAARGRDLVHVELSLEDPATAALPLAVHDELGVFFGGIVPELRDGDVLRMQWLNGVEADPSDVAVASDFGAELLAYVFERKRPRVSVG